MNKKIFALILVVLGMFILGGSNYKHSCYSVKCAKCVEAAKKWPGHYINIAWRATDPYKIEGDKVYAKYKCAGGHEYWAELK
jgi:hypothetical protein